MSRNTRKSSSKDPGSKPTETRPEATYLRTKISFPKESRSEQRWYSEVGWTIPGLRFRPFGLINKNSSHPTQRLERVVVHLQLEINVAPCIAGGREA